MTNVRITATAEAQARVLDAWWRLHRSAAPELFAHELANAFALLTVAPGAGAPFRRGAHPGVRRLVLRRTRNLVFYRYSRESDVVDVLAVWGGPRGTEPDLG